MEIGLQGRDVSGYGKSILTFKHNLHSSDLFSDAGLIQAIDNHPVDALDICTRGSFSTCLRAGASGADLLEAVRRGALWLNLRRIEQVESSHGKLVGQMHSAFEKRVGVKASSRIGGLLISSPQATVGYHIDITDVTLWHLRGKKRIFIYPNREPFIRPKHIQAIALAAGVEKIPYDPSFEVYVKPIDLEPGDMVCWPHLSPHRVDNMGDLNVSLSLESLTMASRLRMGAHFFDGYMNGLFVSQRGNERPGLISSVMKTSASVLIKHARLSRAHSSPVNPTFKINLAHPDCIEPI